MGRTPSHDLAPPRTTCAWNPEALRVRRRDAGSDVLDSLSIVVAEPLKAVVLFGQSPKGCQDLSEHDLTHHHLLEQTDPVLGLVEVPDLVVGDLVGEPEIGLDLCRVPWVGVVGG